MHDLVAPLFTGDLVDVFSAAAVLGCFYLLAASVIVLRHPQPSAAFRRSWKAATILKPLHGAEPSLRDRLLATCLQDYDGEIQVVCGCHDSRDPAVELVQSLQASLPDRCIDLVVDGRIYGVNRKISNLMNMEAAARHDLLVMTDSDMQVGPDYLARVLAPLEESGVGAVTCLYHGVASEGLAARLSAQAINGHFLPSVLFAKRFKLASPCFGSTIALRRSTLGRIGGFRAFVDQLADDYAMGQAIRAAGLEVAVPSFTLGHVCSERSLREFLAHQLRLAKTIRSVDPCGHAASFLTNPLPLALFGLIHLTPQAAALVAVAAACRSALIASVAWRFRLPGPKLWLAPLNDTLLFGVYLCSFFGSTVTWRGHRYHVASNGGLSHDRS